MPVNSKPIKNPVSKKSSTSTPKESLKINKQSQKDVSPEIKKLVSTLNSKFGERAVNIGFDRDEKGSLRTVKRIPTGSFTLDVALGGGVPVGRFIQISGALSSTKTTQATHIIKNAQDMGLVCAFADVENTSDEMYMQKIGVNTSTLIYSNPDSLEEATEFILSLQKSGLVHLAVLDSIAALSSNKEQSTNMEDTVRMGITQTLLGEFCRKFQMNNNRLVREGKEPFTLICINQLREKIGAYGDPEYTPGGRAIGFTASVDIRLRRGDWISEGTGANKAFVGQVTKFKVEKNKTYKRMQTGEFDFYYDDNNAGVPELHNDTIKEVITCGVEWGVITRSGAWFMYEDMKYQGLNALIDAMRSDEGLIEEIKSKVITLATKRTD